MRKNKETLISHYSRWAEREHSLNSRIAASVAAGVVFVLLLPITITRVGPSVDRRLGIQPFGIKVVNYLVGGALLVVGLFFGWWVGYNQITRGRGTPLPVMPTQELLTRGPFRFCRNPMTLGTIMAYFGIAVVFGTSVGAGIALGVGLLLMLYLKLIEERELAARFGDAYEAYRREVPFIIPRIGN